MREGSGPKRDPEAGRSHVSPDRRPGECQLQSVEAASVQGQREALLRASLQLGRSEESTPEHSHAEGHFCTGNLILPAPPRMLGGTGLQGRAGQVLPGDQLCMCGERALLAPLVPPCRHGLASRGVAPAQPRLAYTQAGTAERRGAHGDVGSGSLCLRHTAEALAHRKDLEAQGTHSSWRQIPPTAHATGRVQAEARSPRQGQVAQCFTPTSGTAGGQGCQAQLGWHRAWKQMGREGS